MNPNVTNLDLRGMKCPAPIVATSKAVSAMDGRVAVLRILADDEAFPLDIRSWCQATRSELASLDRNPDGVFAAVVRVNPGGESVAVREASLPAVASRDASLPAVVATQARELDCRGKQCPEPIIILAKEARKLSTPAVIEVLADDDAFPMDVRSWCRTSGSTLLGLEPISSGGYRARIRTRRRQSERRPTASELENDATLESGVGADPAADADGAEEATLRPPIPLPRRPDGPGVGTPTPVEASTAARPGVPARQRLRVDLSSLPADKCREYLSSLDHLTLTDAVVRLSASHATFAQDVAMWCTQAGHVLERINTESDPMQAEVRLNPDGGRSTALAVRGTGAQALVQSHKQCTLLVLHNDLESLLAAMMTANAAASSGMSVNVFFAFWGINVLRGDRPRPDQPREKVSFMQRMFKAMMPRGPRRQRLGKLSFGGMGGRIMRGIMRRNDILNLEHLIDESCALGVRFTVCTMSMSVMGITRRDLVDLPNMEYAGVTSFVGDAAGAGVNLVF